MSRSTNTTAPPPSLASESNHHHQRFGRSILHLSGVPVPALGVKEKTLKGGGGGRGDEKNVKTNVCVKKKTTKHCAFSLVCIQNCTTLLFLLYFFCTLYLSKLVFGLSRAMTSNARLVGREVGPARFFGCARCVSPLAFTMRGFPSLAPSLFGTHVCDKAL